ncbi:MAG: hypothetical protein ACR2FG_15825 [Marmoricola sp.]
MRRPGTGPGTGPRLAAGCAVLALAVSGCGSRGPAADPSTTSSSAPASSGALGPVPTATPSTRTDDVVQGLREKVARNGAGDFSLRTTTVAGEVLANITGRYSLPDRQVAAELRVPQGADQSATARMDLVKDVAFLQVAQWRSPARTCWLRTTTEQIAQHYQFDVATTDEVPLPIALLDNFTLATSSGKGLIDGKLDLSVAARLLTGSVRARVLAAHPQGVVPAFLTFKGNSILITVSGYALSSALAQSLQVKASQFSTVAAARYEAAVRMRQHVTPVGAPDSASQMSAADLSANRCG